MFEHFASIIWTTWGICLIIKCPSSLSSIYSDLSLLATKRPSSTGISGSVGEWN